MTPCVPSPTFPTGGSEETAVDSQTHQDELFFKCRFNVQFIIVTFKFCTSLRLNYLGAKDVETLTPLSPTRAGCVSSCAGRRTRALRTARCGRTCAPSGGSWGCLRATATRSTRRSPDSNTASGCRRCCTCPTSR